MLMHRHGRAAACSCIVTAELPRPGHERHPGVGGVEGRHLPSAHTEGAERGSVELAERAANKGRGTEHTRAAYENMKPVCGTVCAHTA